MEKKKSICLLLTFIILLAFPTEKDVFGFYVEVDPKFAWQVYYEDNISGSGYIGLEDFSNRYEPTLDFSINSSRFAITGKTEIEIIEYTDEKEWNTVEQDHQINALFMPFQGIGVNISAGYRVDSDPDRYLTQEEGLLGTEADYTVKRHKNKTKFCGTGFNYFFSERSNLSSLFMLSNFETGATDDSNFYSFFLNYQYSINRKTSLALRLFYSFFDFSFSKEAEGDTEFLEDIVAGDTFDFFLDADHEMDTYNISCALTHSFSRDLNLNFSLGWRYVETERTSKTSDPETGEMITVSDKGSGSGGTFSLSLQKNFSHTSMRFKADQNVGTNPNTGGTYERRRFSISVSHELTHSLKGDISLSYHDREADRDDEFGGSEIDRETYYISPRISYKYNNWLTIAMSYRYSKDKDNRRNREYDRNTFYLQLNFTLLRPYIIR